MTRIIAKLDVKPPFVVKPVHFEGLRKVGTPEALAFKYFVQGADEIIYVDIVSSLYQRNILFEQVANASKNIFIPFGAGGGVRSIGDFRRMLAAGADKVLINTFALQTDASIIDEAAKIFGSQSVVVNIEAKKVREGWICYSDCGRIPSARNLEGWAHEVQERGAGEILLQSVDHDGRQRGFDKFMVRNIVTKVNIPVVAASGAGSLQDVVELVSHANPSGVSIASALHYGRFTVSDLREVLSQLSPSVEEGS